MRPRVSQWASGGKAGTITLFSCEETFCVERTPMNPPGTQAVRPLTVLSEEEILFRTVIRDYAETAIAPLVSRMDDEAQYDPALIPGLFDLGVMGVEIPEQYGGPGSNFFIACLAVEEISRVDAAGGVPGEEHHTPVIKSV